MINEFNKRFLTSIVVIPLALFFIIKGFYLFIFFLSTILLISIYEWNRLSKNLYFVKILGIFFIILSIYSAYLLREEQGYLLFLFIISISILTDLGGYFFGKLFKGPKFTKISPNKTLSGVIGSFIFSLLSLFVLGFIINLLFNLDFSFILKIKYFFLALIFSSASQIGDLIVSYFKRLEKIKDTGKFLPGHGGIFDRIDGLMFSVIVANICYYFKLFP